MNENVMERLENIQELDRMLDVVANQNKEQIISGKKELVDVIKHPKLTFNIKENDKSVEVTKDVFEIVANKDGILWHEFYDDQGNLLSEISDDDFQKSKILTQLGQASFDDKTLMASICTDPNSKSLSDLENEQTEHIASSLGMNPKDVKELDIISFNSSSQKDSKQIIDSTKEKLEMFKNMGFTIDTAELATSKQTIKEYLNLDAKELLIVKINSEWKALKINDNGSIEIERNLQITDNSRSFSTVGVDSNIETRKPNVEFRRKDNPDYSLAIDNNKETKSRAFLITGESRTASEIEADTTVSPYAQAKNNELMLEAENKPDKKELDNSYLEEDRDPHEPDEPSLEPYENHY